jgi:hypothetical protein
VLMAIHVFVPGSYLPPVLSSLVPWIPPQTIISLPVQTAPFFGGNSPIRFGETKADSVVSGSAYLANNSASFVKRRCAARLGSLALEPFSGIGPL